MPKRHRRAPLSGLKSRMTINKLRKEKKKRQDLLYSFSHPSVEKNWDKRESSRQNYLRIGLAKDVNFPFIEKSQNELISDDLTADKAITKSNIEAEQSVSYSKPPKLSIKDQMIIADLIRKYEGDIHRMSMDMSINTFQWTERQIEKKIKIYNELISL